MNNENRQELLTALRAQRRQQGRLEGLLVAECPATSCPVGEIRMHVREHAGGRLVQFPIKCPRCDRFTRFVRLE